MSLPKVSSYESLMRRRWLILAGAVLLLPLVFLFDISSGPSSVGFMRTLTALLRPDSSNARDLIIVRVLRLPVAAMALVAGASLGCAGAQIQAVLQNPLASPYTLGISSAAAFGAALAIVFAPSLSLIPPSLLIPSAAFLMAMLSILLVLSLARRRQSTQSTLILAGVAISFLFGSLVSLLEYAARENELSAIVFWMFGSLQSANWEKVGFVTLALLVVTPWLIRDAWKLGALSMGEAKARSLGVNTEALRLRTCLAVALLSSVPVCFCGIIGFIGLVAPHLSRACIGLDHRFHTILSMCWGAALLGTASILGKCLLPGALLPIGVTTTLIGLPFLFTLLFRPKLFEI